MAKKEEHKHELLENPEALRDSFADAENWIERHPKVLIGTIAGILIILSGYFGFHYYKGIQETAAQKEMFQAIYYFEQDSLNLALNGDGNNLGFLAIIDDYGISDAAKLANYYAGLSTLKQGKFAVARLYLEDFSSNDILVQARAYSLIGDTYMEEAKFDDAATYYNKAANYQPNKFFSPAYFMKAALAYEKLNQPEKATQVYDKIINEYHESPEYQNARKFKAKLNVTP